MTTLEELVLRDFGVPLEPSEFVFTQADAQGCVAHVGLDRRSVRFRVADLPVAAIRFVVTREDRRREGIASELMLRAHGRAVCIGLRLAVLFSDVTGFYERLGYQTVRPGAMVCALDGRESGWLEGEWEPIGAEW